MKNFVIRLFSFLFLFGLGMGNMWADTKTEGFESASTGNNYQQNTTITAAKSDCGISWVMYGTPSTSSKINGNKSAALRLYTKGTLAYLYTTTPVEGLTNVSFKAKAATTNSASIKINVLESVNDTTWSALAQGVSLSSSVTTKSYNITAGCKFFKIEIASSSTRPSSGNAQLTIDDVVFTYTPAAVAPTITSTDKEVAVDELLDLSTLFSSNSNGAFTYVVTKAPASAEYDLDGKVFLASTVGEYTIVASQAADSGFLASQDSAIVTVKAASTAQLDSIVISGSLNKSAYYVLDAPSRSGLIATAYYNDKSHKEVTSQAVWTLDPELFLSETDNTLLVEATYDGKSDLKEYAVTVSRRNASIAIENQSLGKGESWTIEAATTPAKAALTYEVLSGNEYVSLAEGKVTGVAAGTATLRASYAGNDEYKPASCTFTVTVSNYQTASITSFSAVSGDINQDIHFAAYQGESATAPVLATDNKYLRLYQNGGYVTLTGGKGISILEVQIVTGSTYSSTTIGVAVGNSDSIISQTVVAKESTYTRKNINASSVSFYCLGTDKNTRLDIASIVVKYAMVDAELSSIAVTGNYPTTFHQGDLLTHAGAVVTATYSDGSTAVVTDSAKFQADLSAAGQQTVTVSYTENGVTKQTTYQVEVRPAGEYFYESFDTNNGTGGNDNLWGGTAAVKTFTSDNKWSVTQANGANRCAKFGASGSKGSAISSFIKFSGYAKLTFKAGAWDQDTEKTLLVVSVGNGAHITKSPVANGTASSDTVTMTKGEWTTYTLFLSDVTDSTQITFAGAEASKNRFFLDEVQLLAYTPASLVSVRLDGTLKKTAYYAGETFDPAGLSLIGTYDDGSELDVTSLAVWSASPATLTYGTGGVTVMATYGGKMAVAPYAVSVTKRHASISIADQTMGKGETWTIDATTTPAGASLTYTVLTEGGIVSVAEGKLTALAVGQVTVLASFAGDDYYFPTDTMFSVTVVNEHGATTASMALAGDLNDYIHYQSYKGNGTSDPYITGGCLRLYQFGGYVTVYANPGIQITSVTLTTGSGNATTTIGVAADAAAVPTTGETVAKNTAYTVSDLFCDSVRFYCLGTDSKTRLDVASIQVSYVMDDHFRQFALAEGEHKWGTICLPCAVEPSARKGADFYNITAATRDGEGKVTSFDIVKEEGTLVAGKPYLFYASSNLTCVYSGAAVTSPVVAAGLVGNLSAEPLAVADGNYIINANEFHLIAGATATVGQYRAYLDFTGVPTPEPILEAGVMRISLDGTIMDQETAIRQIETATPDSETIYDLQGRRSATPLRGQIYYQHGRKVYVK